MKKSVMTWVLSGSLVLGSIAAAGSPALAGKKNKQKAKAKAHLSQHQHASSGNATGGNGTGGSASTTGGRSGTVQCIFVPGVAVPVLAGGPFCSSVAGGGGVAAGGAGIGGGAATGGVGTGDNNGTQTQVPANANTQ